MNRKTTYVIAVLSLAGVMVAPVLVAVNQATNAVVAEGSPLPAPVPKVNATDSMLVAEGSPLSAPVPQFIA